MADSSRGFAARLSLAAAGTAIASYTESYEFVSENLKKQLTVLDTAGIRGTRSHPVERTRDGTYTVGGTIKFHATPSMLDLLLPRILGANASGTTFALSDTLPYFDVLIDRVAKRFVYANCKVNKATFRSTAGGLLELELDIIGQTETVSATSFPAITAPTDPPYCHSDLAATLVASSRIVTDFELTIDNNLVARFSNSVSATDVMPSDRVVSGSLKTPYTSVEIDLYNINSSSAAAATFTYTNAGYSISFAIAKAVVPDSSPTVNDKGEIFLPQTFTAKKSSTTNELIVTNDSTP